MPQVVPQPIIIYAYYIEPVETIFINTVTNKYRDINGI